MLSEEICLLHDNANPHTANQTLDLIRSLGREQLDHPPYSLDLAQCSHVSEVKTALLQWLSNQATVFYEVGIQILVEH